MIQTKAIIMCEKFDYDEQLVQLSGIYEPSPANEQNELMFTNQIEDVRTINVKYGRQKKHPNRIGTDSK